MSYIFLSHSHNDKLFARQLAADLEMQKHKVWLDEAEIRVGESLLIKIADAIDEVDCVIAIISNASIDSGWVQRELAIAMDREIEEKRVVVLPIALTKQRVPDFLQGKLYADFTDESNYYKGLLELLLAISSLPEQIHNTWAKDCSHTAPVRRVNLDSDDLVSIFSYLRISVLGNDTVPLLSIDVPNERENELWNKGVYEGFISAGVCFLEICNTHIIPNQERADQLALINVVAMGRHFNDVWQGARENDGAIPENTEIYNSYRDIWNVWDNSTTVDPDSRARNAILAKWCPAHDTQSFYLGWHYFCCGLFWHSYKENSGDEHNNANHYISITVNTLIGVIFSFELGYDRLGGLFWFMVFAHISKSLGGEKVDSVLLDTLGISQLIEGDEEIFLDNLEEEFEITDELWKSWIDIRSKYGVMCGIAKAWLDLRSQFEFVGYGKEGLDGEFELRVLKRSL